MKKLLLKNYDDSPSRNEIESFLFGGEYAEPTSMSIDQHNLISGNYSFFQSNILDYNQESDCRLSYSVFKQSSLDFTDSTYFKLFNNSPETEQCRQTFFDQITCTSGIQITLETYQKSSEVIMKELLIFIRNNEGNGIDNILTASTGVMHGDHKFLTPCLNLLYYVSPMCDFASFPATASMLAKLVLETQTTPNSLLSDDDFKQSWLSRLIIFNFTSILHATSSLYITNPYITTGFCIILGSSLINISGIPAANILAVSTTTVAKFITKEKTAEDNLIEAISVCMLKWSKMVFDFFIKND